MPVDRLSVTDWTRVSAISREIRSPDGRVVEGRALKRKEVHDP